jgi:vitamin B12 transporter
MLKFHLFAFLFFIGALCFAQSVTDSMKQYTMSDEIVVTANRIESPLKETASSITVITSRDIASSTATSLYDILQTVPGLETYKSGGLGQISTVLLRGGNSGQALILVDGVRMNMANDPNGTFDFSSLSLNNVDRIEVLRGPQSTLYGSDAMSGVINIITKQPSGNRLGAFSEYGAYNTFTSGLHYSSRYDALSYNVNVMRLSNTGFSSADERYGNFEKDGTKQYEASGQIGYAFTPEWKAGISAQYSDAKTDLDRNGGYNGDDPTYKYKFQQGIYQLSLTNKPASGLYDVSAHASYTRNIRWYSYDSISVVNSDASHSNYDGNRLKYDMQVNYYESAAFVTSAGVEHEIQNAVSNYYSRSVWGDYESTFPNKDAKTTGVYAQQKIGFLERLFLTAGIRYDHHSQFGSITTYRVTAAYNIIESGTKLKATFGTGFKSPSLFNLYDPLYGNIDLKPEKNIGWDAGFDQNILCGNLVLSTVYFSTDYKDLISSDPITYKAINISKALSSGVETALIYRVQGLDVSANYTYLKTHDRGTTQADYDKSLLRRPSNKAALTVNYQLLEKLNINVRTEYVGRRDDKYYAGYSAVRISISDYTIVNLGATYTVLPILKVYGRIENLFDKKYEEIYGYGTPRFSVYFGARIEIE